MPTSDRPVAVVTGAARGLGLAISEAFLRDGHRVALADLSADTARDAALTLDPSADLVTGFAVDVADSGSVDALIAATLDTFGRVDTLVNNAGILDQQHIAESTDEAWDRMLKVHLGGTFACARASFEALSASPNGSIVSLASVMARFGMPRRASYSAAKAGIEALTRTLAVEWAGAGIRANAIAPGYIRTPAIIAAAESGVIDEARLASLTPLGRLGTPEEIADLAVFLASPRASYITGQTIVIDGGMSVNAATWSA